jgi:ABC-type bacteriocin/lantibiotic exporter with double-glycine peptidase domain
MSASHIHRRMLAPEVVQTSAMDCGPAALKCLLGGFGVDVSYGRLREGCQTDVDGASIDTLEEIAIALGLDAEQTMLPVDHLLLPEAKSLPAIVVVRLPDGNTHFVVVWRRHRSLLQVMDPATGRRWQSTEAFLKELYIHTAIVPACGWRAWVESDSFLDALRRRLRRLGLAKSAITQLIENALTDSEWHSIAALDAATRMTAEIVDAKGLAKGRQAQRALEAFVAQAIEDATSATLVIPEHYWMVRPAPSNETGEEQIRMRGAVLVSVRGRRKSEEKETTDEESTHNLSPELVAALTEKPMRAGREILGLLKQDGCLAPLLAISALVLAAGGVMIEALLFQGLFDLSRKLAPMEQRIGAMAAVVVFSLAMLLLELPLAVSVMRLGRRLETRLRVAFLEKIPRLTDRYFQSRLTSDMADRAHSTQLLRALPKLGSRFLRCCFELALTTAGLIWLDPRRPGIVLIVAAITVILPLLMQSRLTERDLRIRNHNGSLGRFYLDAMLGLAPIRAHGAERAVRREHEGLLIEWMRAGFGYWRAVVTVEAVQTVTGFALAAWLLFDHLSHAETSGAVLLMVYWGLNLPALGQEIALIAQQYPSAKNVTLRLLEPLGAPEEVTRERESRDEEITFAVSPVRPVLPSLPQEDVSGVAIAFEQVSVRAAGHLILDGIDTRIPAGSHVAIVGPSGAGKSSLVGLLLGWHRAARGRVLIDGQELAAESLAQIRRETAWVDPTVQLWNRSLIDNMRYGNDDDSSPDIGSVIEAADLRPVLENLPDGLQTSLGESGGTVSGGEGQRVRLGRALLNTNARLVVLDEPFRGLDREKRRELLARARRLWRNSTLLCITHDIAETLDFERVLVLDKGHIVEDASPLELASRADSLYRSLLDSEEEVRVRMWMNSEWRRFVIDRGRLVEEPADAMTAGWTDQLRRVG